MISFLFPKWTVECQGPIETGTSSSSTAPIPEGCPVEHNKLPKRTASSIATEYSGQNEMKSKNAPEGCPVDHNEKKTIPDGCPVDHKEKAVADTDKCPVENARPLPGAGQGIDAKEQELVDKVLSSERATSDIPSVSGDNWTFPSEKQFYKSARAKGHEVLPIDMTNVLAIHNAVNEQSWKEIMRYENLHRAECADPKLLFFHGKPEELSWKARLMSWIDGRHPPFDRHDWIIDRCGDRIRYIVDFYDGRPSEYAPVSIHIDARPELTFGGARDRLRMTLRQWFG